MALFTKNKNRAALFGKQTLYEKCCTPEVEECCYSSDPLPRPICNCEPLFTLELDGDSFELPLIAPLVITSTPQIIDFVFENIDSCPIELDKLSCSLSGPINYPGFTIEKVMEPTVVPGNSSLTIYSIEVDNTALDGSYEFNYGYRPDCGDQVSGIIQVEISLL
jgi:hypothetical protein